MFQYGRFIVTTVLAASILFAQNRDGMNRGELKMLMSGYKIEAIQSSRSEVVLKKKSPAVGILLSSVVPGAGEIYSGSWIKGVIFLGIETTLWIGYWRFSEKGSYWKDVFHDYADQHWSEERYYEWLSQHPEFSDTTHTLPSSKTQQYYEMIGKYDQFKAGWDDWEEGDDPLTKHRNYYEGLRNKSNMWYIRASYCTMIVLANHVLSAFDTAWTIRGHNRKLETRLRMSLYQNRMEIVPMLSLRVDW